VLIEGSTVSAHSVELYGGNPGGGRAVEISGDQITVRDSVVDARTNSIGGGIAISGSDIFIERSQISSDTLGLPTYGGPLPRGGFVLFDAANAVSLRDSTVTSETLDEYDERYETSTGFSGIGGDIVFNGHLVELDRTEVLASARTGRAEASSSDRFRRILCRVSRA
jgi:hypothetical protein